MTRLRGAWMRGFLLGVVVALVALVAIVIAVTQLGLYPIGADNPPTIRAHACRTGDERLADKHKPAGDNPIAPTTANLTEGHNGTGALRVVPRRREGEDQPDAESVQPACTAADRSHSPRPALLDLLGH